MTNQDFEDKAPKGWQTIEGGFEAPEDVSLEPAEGNLAFVHQLDDCPFDQSKGG